MIVLVQRQCREAEVVQSRCGGGAEVQRCRGAGGAELQVQGAEVQILRF